MKIELTSTPQDCPDGHWVGNDFPPGQKRWVCPGEPDALWGSHGPIVNSCYGQAERIERQFGFMGWYTDLCICPHGSVRSRYDPKLWSRSACNEKVRWWERFLEAD